MSKYDCQGCVHYVFDQFGGHVCDLFEPDWDFQILPNGQIRVTGCNNYEPFQSKSVDDLLAALLSTPGKDITEE